MIESQRRVQRVWRSGFAYRFARLAGLNGFSLMLMASISVLGAVERQRVVIPAERMSGREMPTFVQLPPPAPAADRGLGLIIGLHGLGGDERSTLHLINKALQPNGLEQRFIVLGLKSLERGWTDGDQDRILSAIAWLREQQRVDPDRIILWGESNGGGFAGRFAPQHSRLFAGVVLISGTGLGKLPAPVGIPGLRWLLYHGDVDTTVNANASRRASVALGNAGYRHLYREVSGQDHFWPDRRTEVVLPDAGVWMAALRLSQFGEHDERLGEVAALHARLESGRGFSNREWQQCAAIPDGPAFDGLLISALSHREARTRAAAVAIATQRLLSPEVVAALIVRLQDGGEMSQAAVRALARQAAWREPAAIAALVDLIEQPSGRRPDRLLAAASLAAAQRTENACSNRDPGALAALERIAAGSDPELRAVARAGLAGQYRLDPMGVIVPLPQSE